MTDVATHLPFDPDEPPRPVPVRRLGCHEVTSPEFNAEQAVKRRLGDKHVEWRWIGDDGAFDLEGRDVTKAYRDALIEAHRTIAETRQALARNRDLNELWQREQARESEARVADRVAHFAGSYSRARDALAVVVAADRHGRKTVRVQDVLDVYRGTDRDASGAAGDVAP